MQPSFVLSQTDGRPMYVQIIEQIKLRIAVGDWPPGFQLPSIRELAVAARVSVITVKRAYQELESEGVIVTRHGKGSFVAQVEQIGLRIREEQLDQHLKEAIRVARSLRIDEKTLKARLEALLALASKADQEDTK